MCVNNVSAILGQANQNFKVMAPVPAYSCAKQEVLFEWYIKYHPEALDTKVKSDSKNDHC